MWILVDRDNSDNTEIQFWHFRTKKEALKHKAAQNSKKYCAQLIGPYKVSTSGNYSCIKIQGLFKNRYLRYSSLEEK
jgi:hypothetical protein